jgi:hypothetical protein
MMFTGKNTQQETLRLSYSLNWKGNNACLFWEQRRHYSTLYASCQETGAAKLRLHEYR